MDILLIVVGKTKEKILIDYCDKYIKRIKRYSRFEMITIPDIKVSKKENKEVIKSKEGEKIISKIKDYDFIYLLDENGKSISSSEFAGIIQQRRNASTRKLAFVVGGAYGFSPEVYKLANSKLSLSKMTFSHQMIRLLFLEQLYRAFTIINNEPYHHE